MEPEVTFNSKEVEEAARRIGLSNRNPIETDPNCFPIKVWQFVNRFVPHNYTVNLYTTSRGVLEDDPQVPCTNWTLKWRGMDWQIVMPDDQWKEYNSRHPEVKRCQFRDWWVVGISGIRKPEEPGRVDVVSIVIEEER